MGNISQEPPPLIEDLKVTLNKTCLVFPLQETERKIMSLSSIDQVLQFNVETVHFFSAHPDFPPEKAAEKLRAALEKILVPYDYLAGRLRLNPKRADRLEINCNRAGAGFIMASSEFPLSQIGEFVYPHPAYRQLIVRDSFSMVLEDMPLCVLQVTSFKCGGFVIGISTNHATFDGISFKTFLENLSSFAADKPLAVTPFNDRQLLAARSPPRVTFSHPELLELKPSLGEEQIGSVFETTPAKLDFEFFRLTDNDISRLKEKAKSGNVKTKITAFNVVTALIWRCKALSTEEGSKNPSKSSTILFAVDIRSRLNPPLPQSYTGNAVLTAYAKATCGELEEGPFSRLVEMVYEGSSRMTDEYARSIIDWGETHKGFPLGDVLVSSWWKLGFADVEYPWGKPKYSCPVVCHRQDIILLLPDINGAHCGVNVVVVLPPKEMEKFRSLFHVFMS